MIKGKQIEDSSISKDKLNLTPATAGKDPVRKSEFDNRKINGKSLATDITLNKTDIGLGNIPNLPPLDWPISTATQAALDALEDQIQDIQIDVNGVIDDVADVVETVTEVTEDVQTLYDLWDQLHGQAFPGTSSDEYLTINTFATGTNGTGATTNAGTKTITITNGNNGAGASLTQRLDLSLLPENKIGDKIKFRLVFNESQANVINDKMNIKLFVNSVDTPIVYTANVIPEFTSFIEYKFDHIIGSVNEALDVSLVIANDAPNQNVTANIVWVSFTYVNEDSRFKTIVQKVADVLRDAAYQYTFFERRIRTSKADNTGVLDEAQRVQDEIYDAVDSSGIYLLPKGIVKIGTPIIINNSIRIEGIGPASSINPDLNGGLFLSNTDKKIILRNFRINRSNAAKTPSLIVFSPSYINADSVVEGVTFNNMIDAFFIDYVRGLSVKDCTFMGGDRSIILGTIDTTTSNVEISNNTFHNAGSYDIFSATGNNLLINHNIFEKHPTVGGWSARNIQIGLGSGNYNNVNITNNIMKAFSQYSIRVAGSQINTFLNNLVIANNIFQDTSPATGSADMYVTSTVNGNIKNVIIESNTISNKNIAINTKGLDILSINNNIIAKQTGTWTSSRPMFIDTCTNFVYNGNNIVGQANPISII